MQRIFSPLNTEHFSWTDDGWYSFDSVAAHKAARKLRDDMAKELKQSGRTVSKFSLGSQLVSRGGIGSGKPHVEFIVSCYGLNSN